MGLPRVFAVAEEAALVLVPTMLVQLVAVVETLPAEGTEGVAFEARLVNCSGAIVAVAHVPLELLFRKELMLVCEDLLVAGTEIAHLLVMNATDMAVEIGPPEASKIALVVGAIIPQQQDRVPHNVLLAVSDADVLVSGGDVGGAERVIFEPLGGIICEYDVICGGSAMGALLVLV